MFGVGVGVKANFAQSDRCDMFLLIAYINKQLCMWTSSCGM